MSESIKIFQDWIDQSEKIVFFGGAGVSTESGIPDFRSVDGLYTQKYDEPPETILSHTYFNRYPDKFFKFYRDKMLCLEAEPNAAHKKLAELEQAGKLTAVVTQNIDGLHQKAGSKQVFELHGSVLRNYCTRCRQSYPVQAVKDDSSPVPRCSCGGIIKPDVVLYEEALDNDTVNEAIRHIREADMLIIGGTSLVVYPAASLIQYYRGNKLVLVNLAPTPYDRNADLIVTGKIGEVFSQIKI